MSSFRSLFTRPKPIIGVIHLPALPGYPESPGMMAVIDHALAELAAFEAGGVDGVLVENEHDHPHRIEAARETVAAMTRVARELVINSRTVVGVEILLNDPQAAVAVALVSGARFIRTDYFVDRMNRPEFGGEIAIDPLGLMAYRQRIGADHVLVLADIQVKYAAMIEPRPLADSAAAAEQHGADAVVVSGRLTGDAPAMNDLAQAKQGTSRCPVLIGSGLTSENGTVLLGVADGGFVATSVKTGTSVDPHRVRTLIDVAGSIRP